MKKIKKALISVSDKKNLKSKKTEEIFLDNKREIRNKEQYINESKKLLNQKLIKI